MGSSSCSISSMTERSQISSSPSSTERRGSTGLRRRQQSPSPATCSGGGDFGEEQRTHGTGGLLPFFFLFGDLFCNRGRQHPVVFSSLPGHAGGVGDLRSFLRYQNFQARQRACASAANAFQARIRAEIVACAQIYNGVKKKSQRSKITEASNPRKWTDDFSEKRVWSSAGELRSDRNCKTVWSEVFGIACEVAKRTIKEENSLVTSRS
ncbi:hypothetical protein MRB53_027286 [Persea americana]|uniref:Uncharacterized protein n=1 Tax=Persea americana TaxID=3435 RepID=A0ACC2LKZ7_PERAE|nr:hypothetical protein MRB53_027286 [Persea americana]